MKSTLTLISMFALTAVVAGCGEYSKNPATDLATMRENAKTDFAKGPDAPREIKNTVVVEKPVYIVKEQATGSENFILITPDPQMNFNEGQQSQFKIRARVLVDGMTATLKAQGLPEGAKLEKSAQDADLYTLTWTPQLNLVTSGLMKTYSIKLSAEAVTAKTPEQLAQFKGIIREKDISLFLFKNQEIPSELTVTELPAQIAEGTTPTFTVTAKVPGTDSKTTQKPRLAITYDQVSSTPGNSYLELDGSRHVSETAKDPEFIDGKWVFKRVFDTKNIAVKPQLAKDGTVMVNADGTYVRMSLKVYSPNGTSTPETVAKVKITYTKGIAAPRFDVTGLGKKQALDVAPGMKITWNFSVTSADKEAVVKVDPLTSNLPGAPSITCADSAMGAAKQACVLNWTIPCDAAKDALVGDIALTAVTVVNGRNSEITTYKLKTVAASENKKLCAGGN